jgi:hypothetical protein
MRVLVCGGRSFDEWRKVHEALLAINPTVIIQGGANGADALARRWGQCNNVPVVTYEANWKVGKKAGPERNAFMLKDSRPDIVVAFPGGRGTSDMISKANAAGIRLVLP